MHGLPAPMLWAWGWQAGSDSREGGAAEHMHGHCAWQVTGLPAAPVLEVEGMQGLQLFWASLQVHLAQEFILQDSVIPDLYSDRLAWLLAVEDAPHVVLRIRGAFPHS